MGRHRDNTYASPIRIKVETRYGRLGVLALGAVSYASAAAVGAILALTAYAFADVTGNLPETRETRLHIVQPPQPEPTQSYDGRGYEAPVKTTRIIMQNPSCWIGVPRATCEEGTRTFLGE